MITEVVDEANQPVPPDTFGAKILVTVLFSRTQPLIRYEISDSVRLTDRRCSCGRPYALLDGIQGRQEDILRLPARGGGTMGVHPLVFHDALDRVAAGEWQVVQQGETLQLLVASPGPGFNGDVVLREIRSRLEGLGVEAPDLSWQAVRAIPRTAVGKAPLVRAGAAGREWDSAPRVGVKP